MKHLTREAFVFKYYPFVKKITQGTGIFPQILLAQAIIESQGNIGGHMYVGASKLADKYNNYFGIKASSKWKGPVVDMKTGEVINSQNVTVTSKFRVYSTPEDSMRDFVKFLQENKRYREAGVFEAESYADQALKIAAAGYATNESYGEMVQQVASRVQKYISDLSGPGGWNNIAVWIAGVALFFLTEKIFK